MKSRFLRQTWALLKRNAILHLRWTVSTVSQIFITPVLFLLLLFALSKGYIETQTSGVPHPLSASLDETPLAPCQGRIPEDSNCINLMFTPNTTAVRDILDNFLIAHKSRSGYDLKMDSVSDTFYSELPPPTTNLGFIPVPSSDFIYEYVLKYPNSTLLGISFNITSASYKYEVWYNASLFAGEDVSDFFGVQLLYFERTIEEAVFDSSGQAVTFDLTLRPFPTLPLSRVSDTLSAALGPCVYFIVTAFPTIVMAANVLVWEKDKKLRHHMMLMGLRPESWYCSWYITFSLISAMVALVLDALGRAFQFEFFRHCNFGVVFFTFWLHSMAELSLTFFAVVWIRRMDSAVRFATFWYIFGLLFMSAVFSNEPLAFFWWAPKTPQAFRWILIFLPFFNFGVVLAGITTLTTADVNLLSQQYIPPPGFAWADLYKPIPPAALNSFATPPPPIQSWYWCLMNMALYLLLAWYIDSIMPDEFGVRESPLFFLSRKYWRMDKQHKTFDLAAWLQKVQKEYREKSKLKDRKHWLFGSKTQSRTINSEDVGTPNTDALTQYNGAINLSVPACLRVVHLRKEFRGGCIAVHDVSFSMQDGTLLAIVGANGSGKSTMCNVLCGAMPPTAGDAVIDDHIHLIDAKDIIGWCPQNDILFDGLTPMEHVSLYAAIRGVAEGLIQTIAEERLKKVRLWKWKDSLVATLSGGTKRRLSLVLSTIGDPRLLILDEVTTGLDPIGTRDCRNFIQEFKKNRLIILVTHSMEEAEFLADDIIVMQSGKTVAAGTSLRLKSELGKGYRLTLTSSSEPTTIKPPVSSATLETVKDGQIIWRIENAAELGQVVQWANDTEKNGKKEEEHCVQIQAWEISMPTLEDVLLEKKLF